MITTLPKGTIKKPVTYASFPTPFGMMGVASTHKGLCQIVLSMNSEKKFVRHLKKKFHPDPQKNVKVFKDLIRQFNLYFAGKLKIFTCKLDFVYGTPFQKAVWKKLQTIPYGKTRSYQWLAKTIGNPQAVRAVGSANGKNPLSIIVPCHRVIRSNGHLGGYTGGVHFKRFLLDLEEKYRGLT